MQKPQSLQHQNSLAMALFQVLLTLQHPIHHGHWCWPAAHNMKVRSRHRRVYPSNCLDADFVPLKKEPINLLPSECCCCCPAVHNYEGSLESMHPCQKLMESVNDCLLMFSSSYLTLLLLQLTLLWPLILVIAILIC
jgi:hypothetical protein